MKKQLVVVGALAILGIAGVAGAVAATSSPSGPALQAGAHIAHHEYLVRATGLKCETDSCGLLPDARIRLEPPANARVAVLTLHGTARISRGDVGKMALTYRENGRRSFAAPGWYAMSGALPHTASAQWRVALADTQPVTISLLVDVNDLNRNGARSVELKRALVSVEYYG